MPYIESKDKNDYGTMSQLVSQKNTKLDAKRNQQISFMKKAMEAIALRRSNGDDIPINWKVDKDGAVTEKGNSKSYGDFFQLKQKRKDHKGSGINSTLTQTKDASAILQEQRDRATEMYNRNKKGGDFQSKFREQIKDMPDKQKELVDKMVNSNLTPEDQLKLMDGMTENEKEIIQTKVDALKQLKDAGIEGENANQALTAGQKLAQSNATTLGYEEEIKDKFHMGASEASDEYIKETTKDPYLEDPIGYDPMDLMSLSLMSNANSVYTGDTTAGDQYKALADKAIEYRENFNKQMSEAGTTQELIKGSTQKVGDVDIDQSTSSGNTVTEKNNTSFNSNTTVNTPGGGSGDQLKDVYVQGAGDTRHPVKHDGINYLLGPSGLTFDYNALPDAAKNTAYGKHLSSFKPGANGKSDKHSVKSDLWNAMGVTGQEIQTKGIVVEMGGQPVEVDTSKINGQNIWAIARALGAKTTQEASNLIDNITNIHFKNDSSGKGVAFNNTDGTFTIYGPQANGTMSKLNLTATTAGSR